MSEKARLFAALELPGTVRTALADWAREQASEGDALRLIAVEHLHVTLCFLGWCDEAEVGEIGDAVAPCAVPVPGLALAQAAWLPPRRPRVLAVDLADGEGALAALQRSVSDALVAAAGYEPEKRPYRPHVTVARVRKGARVRADELVPPAPLDFDGAALTLYRSHLARAGARYEPQVRVAL